MQLKTILTYLKLIQPIQKFATKYVFTPKAGLESSKQDGHIPDGLTGQWVRVLRVITLRASRAMGSLQSVVLSSANLYIARIIPNAACCAASVFLWGH